jgi:hypothetical protein
MPRLIIALGRRYVQYINTIYCRTGTLWDATTAVGHQPSLAEREKFVTSVNTHK